MLAPGDISPPITTSEIDSNTFIYVLGVYSDSSHLSTASDVKGSLPAINRRAGARQFHDGGNHLDSTALFRY